MARTRTPLFVSIADRLARDIADDGRVRLNGARSLAKQYGCAFGTMLKALRLLRERGIVKLDANRCARVAGQDTSVAPPTHRRSWHRVAEAIRQGIVGGTYRAGSAIPKADYFAMEHGCSRSTVSKALRALADSGICYRRGRSWITGSPVEAPAPGHSSSPAPSVLVLLPSEDHWRALSREPKEYRRFVSQFSIESERIGVRLVMAFVSEQSSQTLRRRWPRGREQIRTTVQQLDTYYLGALVPCDHAEIPDLEHWLRWLCELGRPVVWLDRREQGLRSPIQSRTFHRFHADSCAGAEAIVKSFHTAGHRHIGIPRFRSHVYMDSFIDDMRRAGAALSPPLKVTVALEERATMDSLPNGISARQALGHLQRTAVPVVRKTLTEIMGRHPGLFDEGRRAPLSWQQLWRGTWYTHLREFQIVWLSGLLVPLLRIPTITGLVCPGNKNTRFWFWWCDAAGVAVPRDISLISVDNSYDFHPWPLSSIDLGYDYLGYAAAHVFVGDIPVRLGRDRTVTGAVRFLDRGSLGPPRTTPLRADLRGELGVFEPAHVCDFR